MVDKPSQTSESVKTSVSVKTFLAEHRELSTAVRQAQKFSIQLPVIGRVGVPQPRDLAMYGVLGGLAAVGVLEWPTALSLAVGVAVAQKSVKTLQHRREIAAPHGDAAGRAGQTVDGHVVSRRNTTAKLAARTPTARPFPAPRRRS